MDVSDTWISALDLSILISFYCHLMSGVKAFAKILSFEFSIHLLEEPVQAAWQHSFDALFAQAITSH